MSVKKEQIRIAERLQLKLLEWFEQRIREGSLSSTDAATLSRLLMQNGWNLDPTRLPEGLRDKLKGLPKPDLDAIPEDSELWGEA